MRANKLTNSIYFILNEDKFAKYTLRQVYDELDRIDFADYIISICNKSVRNLDTETNIKKAKSEPGMAIYRATTGKLKEEMRVVGLSQGLRIEYKLNSLLPVTFNIGWEDKDVAQLLKFNINQLYNKEELKQKRQEFFTLPPNRLKLSEYSKHSLNSLIRGIKPDKIQEYIISCFKQGLSTEYRPVDGLDIDLRKTSPMVSVSRGRTGVSIYFNETSHVTSNLVVSEEAGFRYNKLDKYGELSIAIPTMSYTFSINNGVKGIEVESKYYPCTVEAKIPDKPNFELLVKEAMKELFESKEVAIAKERFQKIRKSI